MGINFVSNVGEDGGNFITAILLNIHNIVDRLFMKIKSYHQQAIMQYLSSAKSPNSYGLCV